MADNLPKIETLRPRCTQIAKRLLCQLEANAKFNDLLDRLIPLDGLITRADIEIQLAALQAEK